MANSVCKSDGVIQLRLAFTSINEDAEKRFLAKVYYAPSGCWLWQGAISDKKSEFRYGRVWFRGRVMYAHRLSYYLFRGPLRGGREIMHSPLCESEACVNPRHLSQGLHSTNQRKEWRRRYWGEGRELV